MALSSDTVRAVQAALSKRGFDPGPIDGVPGPRTTAAVRAFQVANRMLASQGGPLRYPGTIGPSTLRALAVSASPAEEAVEPPWMLEARRVLGKHERHHNGELRDFLGSDGHALGDPSVFPWCGDFVETCVRLALPDEPIPENPYAARNWLNFGRACARVPGAVVVFWRGSRSGWQGHVGFVAGQDRSGSRVYTLGGNQSNRVSVVPLGADRVLGYRWPFGFPMPGEAHGAPTAELAEMTGGVLSTDEA